MKSVFALICILALVGAAGAAEVLFTDGLEEFLGRRYYWLAEWKLEILLGPDVGPNDRLEVLFGTKGRPERTLHILHHDKSLTLAHAEPLDGYTWLTLPLSDLAPR
ncbi:MAG: hypothetical protein JW810_09690, partial [Sedimentisphaerales bacterium]|nr:hypothetical protein [Sedimentisphaerales bacterium]